MTSLEKLEQLIRKRFDRRVRRARKRVEKVTPLDLAKQMRAAEQEVRQDPANAGLLAEVDGEHRAESQAQEQGHRWAKDASLESFHSERARLFEVDS